MDHIPLLARAADAQPEKLPERLDAFDDSDFIADVTVATAGKVLENSLPAGG